MYIIIHIYIDIMIYIHIYIYIYYYFLREIFICKEWILETVFKPTVILLAVKSTIGPLILLDRSNFGSQIDPRLLWESVHTL